MTQSLSGRSILVVEDEIIIGLMLCNEIAGAGGTPIGPFSSAADAMKEIDCRIIDLVILGGNNSELAEVLTDRGILYMVVSGYERVTLPRTLREVPFVAKPISMPLLMEVIETVLGARVRASAPLTIDDAMRMASR